MSSSAKPKTIMPYPRTQAASVWVLAALLVLMSFPAAPQSRQQDGPTITPNYKDADLSQIIQAVSEVTGQELHHRPPRQREGDHAVRDAHVAGRLL